MDVDVDIMELVGERAVLGVDHRRKQEERPDGTHAPSHMCSCFLWPGIDMIASSMKDGDNCAIEANNQSWQVKCSIIWVHKNRRWPSETIEPIHLRRNNRNNGSLPL